VVISPRNDRERVVRAAAAGSSPTSTQANVCVRVRARAPVAVSLLIIDGGGPEHATRRGRAPAAARPRDKKMIWV